MSRMSWKTVWTVTFCTMLAVSLAGCSFSESTAQRLQRASADLQKNNFHAVEVLTKSILRKHPGNGRAWLLLARSSLASHRYADAVHQFDKARTNGEKIADFRMEMARALIGNQEPEKALALLPKPSSSGSKADRAKAYIHRGDALAQLKRHDKARAAFHQALAIEPRNAQALVGEAQMELAQKNRKQAESLLKRAVNAQPDYAPALDVLARIEYTDNRCQAAMPRLKKALDAKSNALPASEQFQLRAFLADCQQRANQMDAAKRNVARLLKVAPNNVYANYLQALIDIRSGNFKAANSDLHNVLNVASSNVRAMTLLAAVNVAQHDFDAAQTYLNRVLAAAPDNIDALRLRTNLYVRKGESARALKMLQQAYKNNANTPGLRPLLAEVMASLKKDDKAAKEDKATGADSDAAAGHDTQLQLDLAGALVRQGNGNAALAILDRLKPQTDEQRRQLELTRIRVELANGQASKAIDRAQKLASSAPKDARLQRILAGAYLAAGKTDQARATLEQAHQASPGDAGVTMALSVLALRQGDAQKAIAYLQPLSEKNPDNTGATLMLAQALAAGGQQQRLIGLLSHAHERQPKDVRLAQALIRVYLSSKQAKKAVPVARQLVAAHAGNAGVHRLQGLVLLAAGDKQQAIKSLKRAVDIAPDQPSYRLDLAQAQLAIGQTDTGIKELKALRHDQPDFGPAARTLALAQVRNGHLDAALATAAGLQSKAAGSAGADSLTGEVYAADKQYRRAATAFEKAYRASPSQALAINLFNMRREAGADAPQQSLVDWLKRSPKDASTALVLAQWYQAHDQTAHASEQYKAVLDQQPQNVIALNNLALIDQNKDAGQALKMARRAHAAAPSSPAVSDTLGWLLVQNGKLDEGISLLRGAAKGNDTQAPSIRYHLAAALLKTGAADDRAQARSILGKLMASNARFDERQAAQKLLDGLSADGGA